MVMVGVDKADSGWLAWPEGRQLIGVLHCVRKKVDPYVNCYNSTKSCQIFLKFYTCEL